MTDAEPPWLAHRRTLSMRHDAHRYLRQDHERFLPPGAGYREPAYFKARREREALAEAKAAQAQAEAGERAFRNELAAIRFELLLLKVAMQAGRAGRQAKAGFNPDQPRVPAGNPDGGQWTDGSGSPVEGQPFDSAAHEGGERERLIRLAGEIPTNDTPEIPKERPPTERERNRIARQAARRLGRAALVLQAADWLAEKAAELNSLFDPPRALEELRRSPLPSERGYDDHHLIERNTRKSDGSEDHIIFAPENIVRIPRWKHWDIN